MRSDRDVSFFLDGPAALTRSRCTRLAATLQSVAPSLVALRARYRHFIQCLRPPSDSEVARLGRLLEYGEPFDASGCSGSHEALVVPRPGTTSPWSSKATDIARNCGFEWVGRIERGLLYLLRFGDRSDPSHRSMAALYALLHDRMTEAVVEPAGAAQGLFEPARAK